MMPASPRPSRPDTSPTSRNVLESQRFYFFRVPAILASRLLLKAMPARRFGARRQVSAQVDMEGDTGMARIQKSTDSSSLAEVVDRILDKGIVIDAWVKVSLVGIELITIEARVVVASVETYLKYAEAVGLTASAAAPA